MSNLISVITGDIIRSTQVEAAALEHTMYVLAQSAADLAGWSLPDLRFTRFRGDGWQIAVREHQYALRAALFIAARLRADPDALGSRMSIGWGDATFLGSDDLSDARGEAFERSGRGLDTMSRFRVLSIDGTSLTSLHSIIVELLEQHARKWTREQAAAAALALHPDNPTLNDIAPMLGISPQAVNYRLSGGSVQAIRRALTGWEKALEEFDRTGKWMP